MISDVAKSFNSNKFNVLNIIILCNGPTKLFSNLYLTTFLDTSAKLSFPYKNNFSIEKKISLEKGTCVIKEIKDLSIKIKYCLKIKMFCK